jgi:hypothetical protein
VSLGIRIAAKGVVGIILIVTAVAAAMLLDPRASQAYERPWCALTEILAEGVMHENCTLPTFDLCVQEVIAGNRPGSRAASESASTTEGDAFAGRQLTQRQAAHIAGPGGRGFALARGACC